MTKRSTESRRPNADQPVGPDVDDAAEPPAGREQPLACSAPDAQMPALALSMSLLGTRLDMVLGGPHPLLVDIVRHLTRRADHAGEATRPTITPDPLPEDLC